MIFLTYWPYLLLIPTLVLGMFLGWGIHVTHMRRSHKQPAKPAPQEMLESKKQDLRELKMQLLQMDDQVQVAIQNVSASKEFLYSLQQEHSDLLVEISGCESSIQTAKKNLRSSQQVVYNTASESDQSILNQVDKNGKELDMLQQLNANYTARINRLSQQVLRQDSNIARLSQTIEDKSESVGQLKEQINNQDSTLVRLERKYQQRVADIIRAQEKLAERNKELQNLIESSPHEGLFCDFDGAPLPVQNRSRKDVTPFSNLKLDSGGK